MPRARAVCPQPGCPRLTDGGRCADHHAPSRPGTRGYDGQHRTRFRPAVLRRDPICRWPDGCDQPSTDADHWPRTRRQLIAEGADPNDPRHGRGLCRSHHSRWTRITAHTRCNDTGR